MAWLLLVLCAQSLSAPAPIAVAAVLNPAGRQLRQEQNLAPDEKLLLEGIALPDEIAAKVNATEKKTILQLVDEALEQEFPEEKQEGIGKKYNETAMNADVRLSQYSIEQPLDPGLLLLSMCGITSGSRCGCESSNQPCIDVDSYLSLESLQIDCMHDVHVTLCRQVLRRSSRSAGNTKTRTTLKPSWLYMRIAR